MLRQTQSTSTRTTTTAHLAQTMTLLGLTADELQQRIHSELASNPALELVEGHFCPTCHRTLAFGEICVVCNRQMRATDSDAIVFVSPREYFSLSGMASTDEDTSYEEFIPEDENLAVYVMRQIASDLATGDRTIAASILTSLDEDGLLRVPLMEIAIYHHVPVARVEQILRLIQKADPIGVGSATPQEAILIQLEVLSETQNIPTFAHEAVLNGLDCLCRHQYHELGKKIGISLYQAKEITRFVSQNLNPYPARAKWGETHHPTPGYKNAYYHPDIIISKLNGENESSSQLIVEIISPMAGNLRVNPLFRSLIPEAPAEKAEQWQTDEERAGLLVKCIQQRNHTMVRLMQNIVNLQTKFIMKGDAYLNPVTRASLADELDVHESTISRAVSNKSVQLPNGRIIPLSKFFDRSLQIRTEMAKLVELETSPLTDTQIARMLKEKGFPVARRTVAKYRAIEGIMPSHLRQKIKDHKPTSAYLQNV